MVPPVITPPRLFQKILIANRGEIALRIQRACRELGIRTVAVHSTADAQAMHVRLADESVCIGPPAARDSYLNIPAILSAASVTGADAIHPGYGFLSENAEFAEMVEAHGLTFIGPSSAHIRMMGDKITAKTAMASLGVPLVPGSDGQVMDLDEARAVGERIKYPVLIKAAAGGGGRGMKVAHDASELEEAWHVARTEARTAFGNDAVYIEKYLDRPRHIEMQVMADAHGNVVHYGERDCSLQRRHQKLLEEAGSPVLTAAERDALGAVVTAGLSKLGYRNAGTLEFLYQDGQFSFIEMNTRLQVEHPVTEMVSGIDLVREQIRIASGEPLGYTQADVQFSGHAIECRINAEDPATFMPTPGLVSVFHAPGGLGVRVDSALYAGYVVPPYYDSLVAKLIVHAPTRMEAIARMRRALAEFAVVGIKTTIPLHQKIVEDPEFQAGDYTIHWLERFVERLQEE
jgi:acetyl-CoA carboxylase biotin carboxylase subunit